MLASTRSGVAFLDGGAAVLAVTLITYAIASAKRGFSAKDDLDQRFGDQQVRAKTGLEANHAVPALAELLIRATERLPPWALTQTTPEELTVLMQDELQSFDYVIHLTRLGRLAIDHDKIDSHFNRAVRWGFVRGCSGLTLVPLLVYLALWVLLGSWHPPVWLTTSVLAVGLVALGLLIVCSAANIMLRNRLVDLCRRYGN